MPNTPTIGLLKYAGLVGTSGVRTGSLLPRANTPNAEQILWQEFQEAGRVADPDIWTKYNTVMKRPTTFDAMLTLWDEMSSWDLIAAALVEIVDEATQTDANSPGTIWYQCNDQEFEEELNDMLVRLEIEHIIQSQVWHVAALGNHFEKIEYAPNEGILGLSFVHPVDIRRYWLERNRKCIGFRWHGQKPNKEDVFVMPDNQTPVERISMNQGQSVEELWYPWDFLHFRRMFRMRISEHGEPIFAEADGIYKKLRLAIDQMVVHRAQVQPDRYAINIDVQEQPPVEQMKTVQRWRQALRSKLAFGQVGNPNEFNSAADFSSYYNALALDTIIYLAQPKGFSNAIEKLNGTVDVPDVYDIELLTDLFYSIIGMPRAWFGGGGSNKEGGEAPSGKALLAQDIRFLRKIKSIRRPITNCYEWLGYFHAVLKGKNIEQLDIKAMMPPIGSLEEQMKLEMLKAQAEVLDVLADVMDKYKLPKEAWIETIFKRYMHLPDEVVNVFITALPGEIEQEQPQESLKRKPAPYTFRLIREIEGELDKNPRSHRLIEQLRSAVYGESDRVRKVVRRRRLKEVLQPPDTKDLDVVISSFGKHPFELRRPGKTAEGKVGAPMMRMIQEAVGRKHNEEQPVPTGNGDDGPAEPYYRRWVK
jgi:Bacteriophage T4-like portal protein (Gp20)